ncbi:MAG: hypothetical protein D6E12_15445 [Desulfovibrio sp.]|nr:MAG: hypothetical protein D6E12_15445 [Desulfovibrio sp.]
MKIIPGNGQFIGARKEQQDSIAFSDVREERFSAHGGVIAILADGMGGLAMGREASQTAVDSALMAYGAKTPDEAIFSALNRALVQANQAVFDLAVQAGQAGDVGTTLLAAVIHQGKLYWASVGDSRLYLFRNGRLFQMTTDHAYAKELERDVALGYMTREEAEHHPDRNALTSFVGLPELMDVDRNLRPYPLREGDRVMLVSDGVYGALAEDEMAGLLAGDPQQAAEALIKAVYNKDLPYQDNSTVAVFAVEPDNTPFTGVTDRPEESLTVRMEREEKPQEQADRTVRLADSSGTADGPKRRSLWVVLVVVSVLATLAALYVILGTDIIFPPEPEPAAANATLEHEPSGPPPAEPESAIPEPDVLEPDVPESEPTEPAPMEPGPSEPGDRPSMQENATQPGVTLPGPESEPSREPHQAPEQEPGEANATQEPLRPPGAGLEYGQDEPGQEPEATPDADLDQEPEPGSGLEYGLDDAEQDDAQQDGASPDQGNGSSPQYQDPQPLPGDFGHEGDQDREGPRGEDKDLPQDSEPESGQDGSRAPEPTLPETQGSQESERGEPETVEPPPPSVYPEGGRPEPSQQETNATEPDAQGQDAEPEGSGSGSGNEEPGTEEPGKDERLLLNDSVEQDGISHVQRDRIVIRAAFSGQENTL